MSEIRHILQFKHVPKVGQVISVISINGSMVMFDEAHLPFREEVE